jgi:hypothetical protein
MVGWLALAVEVAAQCKLAAELSRDAKMCFLASNNSGQGTWAITTEKRG